MVELAKFETRPELGVGHVSHGADHLAGQIDRLQRLHVAVDQDQPASAMFRQVPRRRQADAGPSAGDKGGRAGEMHTGVILPCAGERKRAWP